MITISHTARSRRAQPTERRPRRGVALVFVMVFVIAMAALAMSSIFMASNANLLAKSYDRERDLKYAAEAALAMGKSRVNADPNILTMKSVGQLDTAIMLNQTLTGADGNVIPGITVNVYVGPTGSTSGQFGRFSSIVAEARDQRGNGFIRRLELTQESFAKFAYWSNSENSGSSTIFFNNGDALWGPVWSNDTINIGSGGATFHDVVGTVYFVAGANYGVFSKGKQEYQKPIPLPSTSLLATLGPLATGAGWNFTAADGSSNDETSVRDRIEFLAFDVNASGDSTDLNEGFFRYYTAKSGNESALRGDWPAASGSAPALSSVNFCGDWHWIKDSNGNITQQFFVASMHSKSWLRALVKQGYIDKFAWTATKADSAAKVDSLSTLKTIMANANARCYLAGDPHLVSVDRSAAQIDPKTSVAYTTASFQKGGTDTTFTPSGVYGAWKQFSATPLDTLKKLHPWDAPYLFAIDRGFNANAKGVIYVTGNLGVSGTLNGRITLYTKGTIVLLDDIRYANDPVKGVCRDILGLIADKDVVIADNAINDPQVTSTSGGTTWDSMDDTKDIYIHAVMMALSSSFRVQNYDSGPTDVNECDATTNGRGCIYLSGGIIQQARGAVGTSAGTGYAKRYTYDHCAIVNPPPYFPTTGRFQDNRYLELDPAGFNHTKYFQSLTPNP